jgi:hypothetical protein
VWRVKGNKFDNQYECVFHVHEVKIMEVYFMLIYV